MIPRFLALVCVGIAAVSGSRASAFTLVQSDETPGNKLVTSTGWQTKKILFDVDYTSCPGEEKTNALMDAAFDVWNGVRSADLTIARGQKVTKSFAVAQSSSASGNPLVKCSSSFTADGFGEGVSGDNIPGFATNIRMDANGKIVFALIVLNNTTGKANVFNLGTGGTVVVAHELGHALGLGHSPDETALMYYATTTDSILALTPDDVDGLTYLYPRKELGGDGLYGCASVAAVAAGGRNGRGTASGGPPSGEQGAASYLAFFALAYLVTHLGRAGRSRRAGRLVRLIQTSRA